MMFRVLVITNVLVYVFLWTIGQFFSLSLDRSPADSHPGDQASWETIRDLALQSQNREQFLNKLSTSAPHLFDTQHHILAFQSYSLCEGVISYKTPRVIHFDNNSKIMLAYAGTDGDFCSNQVEVIRRLNKENSVYSTEKIIFPDNENTKPSTVIEENSASCTLCHGKDNLPIFRFLSLTWPRFFGQNGTAINPESPEGKGLKEFITQSVFKEPYFRLQGYHDIQSDLSNLPRGARATFRGNISQPISYLIPNAQALRSLDGFTIHGLEEPLINEISINGNYIPIELNNLDEIPFAVPNWRSSIPISTIPKEFNKCLRCHVNPGHVAFYIPFDRPILLKEYLNISSGALYEAIKKSITTPIKELQMPPSKALSPAEQKQLLDALQLLR